METIFKLEINTKPDILLHKALGVTDERVKEIGRHVEGCIREFFDDKDDNDMTISRLIANSITVCQTIPELVHAVYSLGMSMERLRIQEDELDLPQLDFVELLKKIMGKTGAKTRVVVVEKTGEQADNKG